MDGTILLADFGVASDLYDPLETHRSIPPAYDLQFSRPPGVQLGPGARVLGGDTSLADSGKRRSFVGTVRSRQSVG
jgi:hypothetical protein